PAGLQGGRGQACRAGAAPPSGPALPRDRPQPAHAPRPPPLPPPPPPFLKGPPPHPRHRGPPGPYRHLPLPESGQRPPPHRPPGRHGVSPPVPAARLAARLHESPPLRCSPYQLGCPSRDHPPPDRAGPPRGG